MTEVDVWQAAKAMIDLYGLDAAIHAALRADALLDQGDPVGCRHWTRVVEAIKNLQEPSGRIH